jgi:putative acyl-CoA dehydrogenase
VKQRASDFAETAETHRVFNVPEPLQDYNAYRQDHALHQCVKALGGEWAEQQLCDYGAHTGSADMIRLGFLANANPPQFRSHDRVGRRLDLVEYHPAYHELMGDAIAHGIHSDPWVDAIPGAHVHRAAMVYLQTQVEQGHGCPLTMTFACVPTLRLQQDLAHHWLPKVLAQEYDPRDLPVEQKAGVTIGMAMTEKQGGSDVRSNTTRASPLAGGGAGQLYQLVGHKFFMSAPMSDAFLMLAQTGAGLSCFLVPRWCPDGSKNRLYIQRLKDKMGNISNASSEVELRAAQGWLIGEEGRGVANIIEMVALTRFDCMLASAAAMRQATVQALHHCSQRSAFGKALIEQPLMQNVLADLVIESDAALVLAMRMARALDHPEDAHERTLLRLGTAVGKYWVCKRTPAHNYEAMECLGGTGVMEEGIMARLYREAPINAIWEGSGNIQCLDVLRALGRNPETLDALRVELAHTAGMDPRLDQHVQKLETGLREDGDSLEYRARTLVDDIALALQASLLLRYGDERVAQGFIAGRLQAGAHLYGSLPAGVECQGIIERAWPDHGYEPDWSPAPAPIDV